MPNGWINRKGKLEKGSFPSNRNLLNYNEALSILNAVYGRNYKEWKWVEPEPTKVNSKHVSSKIIRSIHDKIEIKKFTGNTVALFKGKSYLYMAENYPHVLRTFIKQHKDIIFQEDILRELTRIIDSQIKNRNSK